MSMKILLLSTGGKIGGEETFTRNLAISLIAKGHVVEVAVGGSVQAKDLNSKNISICPVDITSRTPLGLLKAAKQLTLYVSANGFDIVHAQAIGPAIMGVLAKKYYACTIPWIWHNHGITGFSYKYIVSRLNTLNAIIANSDYVRESLKGHKVKAEIIKRVHNGICVEDFSVSGDERLECKKELKKSIKASDTDKLLIYVGRLSPEKGVEVLLKAFERLYKNMPNVQCVLVGDGIQKKDLQMQITNYTSKQRIHFLGFRKDIKELVAACDVLVLPSHIETFSLTTLQAFATDTPCIASDVGGTPEQVLDKFNGLLFKDNDSDELSEKLQLLLANDDLHDYLVRNAKKLSTSYLNTDRMTRDIENIYVELIKK